MSRMVVKKFTSSGSWTAPAGVTRVSVRAWGGGAGGENPAFFTGPGSGEAGPAGGCAPERIFYIDVVPNTTYTITIGTGGTAGTSGAGGGSGGNTTFGSLATGVGCYSLSDTIALGMRQGFPSESLDSPSPYGSANPGTPGASSGPGLGGFNGPGGNGGAGGNASDAGVATAGASAAANTGAGGGGGGGTLSGTEGNGGAGGSGYLEIMWVG